MSTNSYPLPGEMLKKWAKEIPNQVYLRQPVNRLYREKTWAQVLDEVLRLASALRSLGLQKGDVVAILAKNSAEWFITDFAISAAGLISAPIYPTAGEKTIRYILKHSDARAVVVGKLDKTGSASKAIPPNVVSISMPYESIACDYQMEALIAQNQPLAEVHSPDLDDTFSLIYTSGSTGNPKGVVLTFRNIGYSSTAAVRNLAFTNQDRLISYLPLAHITERAMIQYLSLQHGCTVSFVEALETFQDDLHSARPSMFISVPRLWMKFQSGILAKIPQKKLDWLLRIPVLSTLVKRKIITQLGLQNARICASGAAPISLAVLKWYSKLGIELAEGLGMSETSGLISSHYPFVREKLGTVGRPVHGTEIKLSEQGEILVRSDGVAKAYYKEPGETAETFINGWLHTGDKGEIDADGYIRITCRVKEIFKSGKGKYVAPGPIESMMLENSCIEQICVMGAGLPQPVAVVVLAQEVVKNIDPEQVNKSLAETLQRVNTRLESHEKISQILVSRQSWTIENGLMTPTMKIKRNKLEEKYSDLVSRLQPGTVIIEE